MAALEKKIKKDPTTKAIVEVQKAAPARDEKYVPWYNLNKEKERKSEKEATALRKSAAKAPTKTAEKKRKKKKTGKN
jgi:hypothetical protein